MPNRQYACPLGGKTVLDTCIDNFFGAGHWFKVLIDGDDGRPTL